MSKIYSDYYEGDILKCSRCKSAVDVNDGTCGCVAFADADKKVLIHADGRVSSWEEAFVEGFRLGHHIIGKGNSGRN